MARDLHNWTVCTLYQHALWVHSRPICFLDFYFFPNTLSYNLMLLYSVCHFIITLVNRALNKTIAGTSSNRNEINNLVFPKPCWMTRKKSPTVLGGEVSKKMITQFPLKFSQCICQYLLITGQNVLFFTVEINTWCFCTPTHMFKCWLLLYTVVL